MGPLVLLMCSQVERHRCEVVMVTFSPIGRTDVARMLNLFEAYGDGSGGPQY